MLYPGYFMPFKTKIYAKDSCIKQKCTDRTIYRVLSLGLFSPDYWLENDAVKVFAKFENLMLACFGN